MRDDLVDHRRPAPPPFGRAADRERGGIKFYANQVGNDMALRAARVGGGMHILVQTLSTFDTRPHPTPQYCQILLFPLLVYLVWKAHRHLHRPLYVPRNECTSTPTFTWSTPDPPDRPAIPRRHPPHPHQRPRRPNQRSESFWVYHPML